MPEPPQVEPNKTPLAHTELAMRMLYDEQTRLRGELEELRKKQDEEGKQQDKGEDGGEGKDDKKEGDDKGKDGDKDKKEGDKQQKPPFKQRARDWVREHPIATLLIIVGTIIFLIAAVLLWRYLDSYVTTDDAFVDGHTDPISARINGMVTASYVENTYHVKKGQLLVELDPRDYQVAKERAQANYSQAVASARAQEPNVPITATTQSTAVTNAELSVASAAANVSMTEERYRSAQADLHEAEANQANAAREEERYRLLVAKEEVSRELYDQRATQERAQAALVASRKAAAEAAQKSVDQAIASLGQAKAQEKQTRENLPKQIAQQRETLAQRQATAQVNKAEADQAELNLEYTRIYAPEDGIIGDKQVQVATQVQAGQELFALTQTNDIWVTANYKETQIKRMLPGQSVTLHVDALGVDFEGYIEALPGASGAVYSLLPPENATGNYVKVVQRLPVRIRLRPNQPQAGRLAPGMSVVPKVWVR